MIVDMELYIPFVVAAAIVLIIPGPTIVLVIGQALVNGRRAVPPLVAGVTLGDLTALTSSLVGLGAILAASSALFNVLKWAGALYLIYLGVRLWRHSSTPALAPAHVREGSASALFRGAFIVTALNPKSIAFFVAFLPQFIADDKPVFTQLVVLGTTFLVLAAGNAALYGLFAGQLGRFVRQERWHRLLNRCGGSALIGAGLVTASLEHGS